MLERTFGSSVLFLPISGIHRGLLSASGVWDCRFFFRSTRQMSSSKVMLLFWLYEVFFLSGSSSSELPIKDLRGLLGFVCGTEGNICSFGFVMGRWWWKGYTIFWCGQKNASMCYTWTQNSDSFDNVLLSRFDFTFCPLQKRTPCFSPLLSINLHPLNVHLTLPRCAYSLACIENPSTSIRLWGSRCPCGCWPLECYALSTWL